MSKFTLININGKYIVKDENSSITFDHKFDAESFNRAANIAYNRGQTRLEGKFKFEYEYLINKK